MEENQEKANDSSDYHGGFLMESVIIKDAAKPLIDFVKGTQEYKKYFFEKDKLSLETT